jgi:hypothetical protein
VSNDLRSQLADYGRDHRTQQRPVDIAASSLSASVSPADGVADQVDSAGVDDADVIVVEFDGPAHGRQTDMRNKWIVRAGVAAAAAIAVIVGVMLFDDDEATTDAASGRSPAEIVEAYFAAYNAGDAETVVSLLTLDATLTDRFGEPVGEIDPGDALDREGWEEDVESLIAQGTLLSSHSCIETNDEWADATGFSCEYELLDAPTRAVGALPFPVTTKFAVSTVGKISEWHTWYDPLATGIDFVHVGRPFGRWLQENHPEFAGLSVSDQFLGECCELMSPTERGLLVKQYAEEWAAYLDENGCTYLEVC